jgi:hypothetical protein
VNNSTEIVNVGKYSIVVAGHGAEFVSASNQEITHDVSLCEKRQDMRI